MEELSAIVKALIDERDRLNIAIAALQGVGNSVSRPKRRMSAAGRARIVAAQRVRWAKLRAAKKKKAA